MHALRQTPKGSWEMARKLQTDITNETLDEFSFPATRFRSSA